MRHILYCTLFFIFFSAGCQKPAEEIAPAPEPANAAKVGASVITEEEIERLSQYLGEEDRKFAQTSIGRANFINALIRERLAEMAAREARINEQPEYINALKEKRAQLEEIYKEFAQQTLIQLWYKQLAESGDTAVTEEEIKAYFKKYPYEMTLKQIIIANAQDADIVLRALKRSPSRWKELERQYSVSPQATRGKEFSVMPGEFLPEIEVVAANSPTGSVQGFIKTAQGFHIIMKTKEKRLSLKDAKPRIEQILRQQKEDAILENLKNKYEVVVYEKNE